MKATHGTELTQRAAAPATDGRDDDAPAIA